MWIVRLLSVEVLQLFMIEKGLHPEIIIHPQSLKLLRQQEVCQDHIVDLNSNGLVFPLNEKQLTQEPLVWTGTLPQISWVSAG